MSPLGPCCVALVAGIAAAALWPFGAPAALALAVATTLALAVATARRRRLAVAGLALAAAATAGLALASPPGWGPPAWKAGEHLLVGRVESTRPGPDGRERVALRLDAAAVLGARLRPVDEGVRLGMPEGRPCRLRRGDRVLLRASRLERRGLANFGDPPRAARDASGAAQAWPLLVEPAPPHLRAIDRARARVRSGLEGSLRGPPRGLAIALAVGDRSALDEGVVDAFRATGTAHLLAVSGLHVSIVTGLVLWLVTAALLRTPLARRRRVVALGAGLAGLACWAYAGLTGLAPPVLRASVMATAALVATGAGRPRGAARAVGLAAAVLLVGDPTLLGRPGFQLSFVAVLALVALGLGGGRAEGRLERLRRGAARAVAASFVATAATAPLVAHHFGQVPLVGVAVNVVAVPAMAFVVLPACLVLALVGAASPSAAALVGPAVELPLGLLVSGLERVAALPGACVTVGRPSFVEALLLSGAALAMTRFRRRRLLLLGAALLVAAGASMALRACGPRLARRMEVTFLSVGSGDATLVDLPGGGRLLVDAGPEATRDGRPPRVVEVVERAGFGRLAVLALTHGHADHAAGVPAVLDRVGAAEYWQPFARDGPLPSAARESGARVVDARRLCGSRRLGGVRLDVLHPCGEGAERLGENDRSLVLRLVYGRIGVLLPGDVEREGEAALLEGGPATLESEVLKLPHHGSDTSSSEGLLDAVRPVVAVASCGRSRSRPLPHEAVRERLARRGVTVLSTAEHGAVRVSTDGEDLRVEGARVGSVPAILTDRRGTR